MPPAGVYHGIDMTPTGLEIAEKGEASSTPGIHRHESHDPMKQSETQKYGYYLKQLTTQEIEKLLASVLHEMRRRDSERLKGDVLNTTKLQVRLKGTA